MSLVRRLQKLAMEMRGEADRWSGGERRKLLAGADTLHDLARGLAWGRYDEKVAAAYLEAGTSVLVDNMTRRALRELDAKGATQ